MTGPELRTEIMGGNRGKHTLWTGADLLGALDSLRLDLVKHAWNVGAASPPGSLVC